LLVARAFFYLIPEYVAVALPIALFLASGLAFRRLALSGELDILAASGLGTRRILLVPAAFGLLTCALLIGLRGYVQPVGEEKLDRIGYSVAQGLFGIPLKPRIANVLPPHTQLYFDHLRPESNTLTDVVIEQKSVTMLAGSASLIRTRDDRLILGLRNGIAIWRTSGGPRRVQFETLSVTVPLQIRVPAENDSPRNRLDRLTFAQLGTIGAAEFSRERALASAAGRIAAGGLCLCLPMLGFALGVPPKRSTTGLGLFAGILIIVLYWKIAAFAEDHLTGVAPFADAALVIACWAAAAALLKAQDRKGFGAIERFLATFFQSLAARCLAFRPAGAGNFR
jgi:lipopolysaccharide export system permease protein